MGGATDWVMDDVLGMDAAAQAATASTQAAATQAGYQKEALDYLKQQEKLPTQFREGALTQLAGLAGLPGGEGSQQEMIQRAIQSPLYQSIIGGRQAGEEAILRNASATGGLRSGNVQENLYDYNTQLQNQALLQSYNQQLQGLQGLSSLPSNANNIAALTGGIGSTLAQGQIAAAQARQQQQQDEINTLMGFGQMGAAAGMFSDRRLKKDIKPCGTINGHKWYAWAWNSVAEKLGLSGKCQGVMADEVFETHPEAVSLKNCFMFVNYSQLGVL